MSPPFRVTAATLDVLEVLLGPDDELYGLRIANAAGRPTGSVYPILARLEEAGWVTSRWETDERSDNGPRRRFYRLDPDGLGAARALLAQRRPGRRRVVQPGGRRPMPGVVPGVERWL